MQIVIDIPEEEFGIDINDKFKDFFQRLRAEIKQHLITNTSLLCGAYELETIDMFLKAFNNGTQLPEKPVSCKFIERNGNVAPYLIVATNDIKALEQEPCEDCVSRQAVLEQTYLWSKDEFLRVAKPFDYLRKRINSLPSVTPKQKTDILDKIRAEIEQERVGYPPSAGYYKAIIKCLQIIDKYKAESEDAE